MTLKPMTRIAFVVLAAMAALACRAGSELRSTRGLATAAAPAAMTALQLSSPPSVKAGERITVTATLAQPAAAPSGAVLVYVGFDRNVFTGPSLVRIPNGQSSATFTLYAKRSVTAARSGAISASTVIPEYALVTRSVSVLPGAAAAEAAKLALGR